MLLGEVVSKATVPYESIMREAVRAAGYDHEDMGMDWRTVSVPMPHLGHPGAGWRDGGYPRSKMLGTFSGTKMQHFGRYLRFVMWLCLIVLIVLAMENAMETAPKSMFIARNGSKSAWVNIRYHSKYGARRETLY